MIGGLPGGSPGPNAEGDWIGLLIMFALGAIMGGGFLYAAYTLSQMSFCGVAN
ncbi:MAG TPA: hypothetical protein P5081_20945 [Phycisphaerae bacterium]|nr:hypothetical protein [Phycisphaerae bacterium]HRW55349.1 hypothetical protein [Phycisphaerae bacterium]